MALPADITFEAALQRADVKARVFDPDLLVVDLDNIPTTYPDLESYVASWPVVNRALRPAMVFNLLEISGATRRLMHVPGALVTSPTPQASRPPGATGYMVAVPLVVSRAATGTETIRWVGVVEEVRPDPLDPASGPFSVAASGVDAGLVALRINLPYQSSAMASFQSNGLGTPNGDSPNLANDGSVTELNSAPGTPLGMSSDSSPVYTGPYGLGRLYLLGEEVRPFRRVVTGQALFRREVFEEQSGP